MSRAFVQAERLMWRTAFKSALERVMGYCGAGWRIFAAFVLMAARDIRSIEQLKHVRRAGAGRVLGLGRLPSLPGVWAWFHQVAQLKRSAELLDGYFLDQLRGGWSVPGCGSPTAICCPIRARRRSITPTTPKGACRSPDAPIWSPPTRRGAS